MSAVFKKNIKISGKFKGLSVVDNSFVDTETGEEINVAKIISDVYGNTPFDLDVTQKTEDDIAPSVM